MRPVSKVFFHYLIPAICATMVTSIYVLADTIIIGKFLGSTAMAALNIVLPVFNVFFGMGLLFGVRRLGFDVRFQGREATSKR